MLRKKVELKMRILFTASMICALIASGCGSETAATSKEQNNDPEISSEQPDETAPSEEDESKDETAPSEEDESKEASEDVGQESEEDVPEEDEQPEEIPETIYEMSDSASLNDWTITVTDAKVVDSIDIDYGSFTPDEDGNKFLQIFITVDNGGKEADTFLPYICMGDDVYAKVLYADDYEFSSTKLLGYDNELHDAAINPLSSKTGEIVFEIPKKISESDDELLIQFLAGSDSLKFKIR